MQVRNLLIAAGTALAGLTGIAAAPTAADAQTFYRHAYVAPHRAERIREIRRIEARRHWEHRRVAEYRFHHRPGFYRY